MGKAPADKAAAATTTAGSSVCVGWKGQQSTYMFVAEGCSRVEGQILTGQIGSGKGETRPGSTRESLKTS